MPMPGCFPQTPVHHVRSIYLDIPRRLLTLAHVLKQLEEQCPALWVPKDRARRCIAEVE